MSVVIIIVAVLLIGYALRGTIMRLTGKGGCCGGGELVVTKGVADKNPANYPYTYKLDIEGMSCNNCSATVANKINAMGDTWAQVNLGDQNAIVRSKSVKSEADFEQALRKSGYKITSFSAQ